MISGIWDVWKRGRRVFAGGCWRSLEVEFRTIQRRL